MEFSVRLKELRVDNDMSQTELAEKLNLKASAISKYEKGITQPSIDTLKNLAEIFSVTVDYLIGMSDIKNPENPVRSARKYLRLWYGCRK